MFYGRHSHKIDTKNRLILPSNYRKVLGERFFVVPSANDKCLHIYSEERFRELEEKLNAIPDSGGGIDLKRFIFGNTAEISIDDGAPYRFVITPELINHAEMGKDVIILGTSKRLEVWDSKVYNDYEANTEKPATPAELMERFGL